MRYKIEDIAIKITTSNDADHNDMLSALTSFFMKHFKDAESVKEIISQLISLDWDEKFYISEDEKKEQELAFIQAVTDHEPSPIENKII